MVDDLLFEQEELESNHNEQHANDFLTKLKGMLGEKRIKANNLRLGGNLDVFSTTNNFFPALSSPKTTRAFEPYKSTLKHELMQSSLANSVYYGPAAAAAKKTRLSPLGLRQQSVKVENKHGATAK